tara:strand:- start:10106 stop:10318 length:213 start_codon:yes stop_codon:yes gene_type:complete
MGDWVTRENNKEIIMRVREKILDTDILDLVLGTEQMIEEGRFPHNILTSVMSVKEIIRKIKHGSRVKSSS